MLSGDDVPGDRESGAGYRAGCECVCEETAAIAAVAENGEDGPAGRALLDCPVRQVDAWPEGSGAAFVVIVRAVDARAFEVGPPEVVESCAVAAASVVEAVVELDLAWKVGDVRARKAEKKFAKNGRFVGILALAGNEKEGWEVKDVVSE